MQKILAIFLSIFCSSGVTGQVKLPGLIRDSMILQRDQKVNIWGSASANEKVQVVFNKRNYNVKADAKGNWRLQLPPVKAGGPYTMEFIASNKILLNEILFGDVWFCSGQSNMVHQMNIHDVTYAKEIAEANHPDIRQFWIPTLTNLSGPQSNIKGYWKAAVGEDVRPFSAVAYFFAKKLNERYHIPIGIINASVGGTPIEAWISEDGFKDFSEINNVIKKNKDTSYINSMRRTPPAMGNRTVQVTDAGISGDIKWFDVSYSPKGWRDIHIPGYWEDQGIKDLNGVVWYRREIEINESMAGKSAKLFLGRIVDADELYINGKLIGKTTYQYPQRRYTIPANTLKTGKNLFVIRVTNTNGKGGFVPGKPYYLFNENDTVSLMGTWQYKVGVAYEPPVRNGNSTPPFSAQNQPASLYNAMVAPAINYNIKGFCWYQGESNASRASEYVKLLPALIFDWRNKWNSKSLPFLNVQLPGFMDYNYLPSESQWAILREAQLKSLSVPNTAMTVTIDLGEWNDIHPDNKKDVGERLALNAMKLAYGEDIISSGPLFESATIEGNRIIVSFTNAGTGLSTVDGEELHEFAIAAADKKFRWAKAKIEGNKVIVWNDEITNPLYVRYAWADNPVYPNLINKEGLPASPFRTDQ